METFSDPGSVLVPHFSGQLGALVELVALGNIHCDPVQRLELKGFFNVKGDLPWTFILNKLNVHKALKCEETAAVEEGFSIFVFPSVVPILQYRAEMSLLFKSG